MILFWMFLSLGVTLMLTGVIVSFPEILFKLLPRQLFCKKCGEELIEGGRVYTRLQVEDAIMHEDRQS